MASDTKKNSFLSQIEKMKKEIGTKFAQSHNILKEKESTLMKEIEKLVVRYKGEDVLKQIDELEHLKELQLSSVRDNQNKEIVRQSVAVLETNIREIRGNFERDLARMKRIELKWDEKLLEKLSEIGKIEINEMPSYEDKGDPSVIACKFSAKKFDFPSVFCYPNSIAIDARTENIYICDSGNNRIQVFTNSFEFLFDFKEKMDWPAGVYVNNNKVYTTQLGSGSLNVYDSKGKFLNSVGKEGTGELEFLSPSGLAVSDEKIYICEYNNNRVQCLNTDLTFHSFMDDIPSPRDVKITNNEIVVLTSGDPCIQYYDKSHKLLRQIISSGENGLVSNPWYICIDAANNVIMTDMGTNSVLIFSNEGELVHKFGNTGERKGEFVFVKGLALRNVDEIIVASENPNHCLQVF